MACLRRAAGVPGRRDARNWTMVGICAHESALEDGKKVTIPRF